MSRLMTITYTCDKCGIDNQITDQMYRPEDPPEGWLRIETTARSPYTPVQTYYLCSDCIGDFLVSVNDSFGT